MKKTYWRRKIIEYCEAAGTYKPFFNAPIETLASILEQRDKAMVQFTSSGGEVLVEHTNQGGATNVTINPALRLINELNRDALAYWRDLGLTPAGLKKIDEKALKEKKQEGITDILNALYDKL